MVDTGAVLNEKLYCPSLIGAPCMHVWNLDALAVRDKAVKVSPLWAYMFVNEHLQQLWVLVSNGYAGV